MSDPDDNVIYRYEPRFEGEFFRGVPARDLTQRDVDRLDLATRTNALAPHPLYGTPLYVKVGSDPGPPRWFQKKQEDAGEVVIEPLLPNETKQHYEDRMAALAAPDIAPEFFPAGDGEA